jgi:D-lactate dehydrogenase
MDLKTSLENVLPKDRIKMRLIDRYAFASDASHFFLVPQAVLQPIDEAEIIDIFKWSREHMMPITFRAGGTSLSGQASTDSILVDISRYWRKVQPSVDGFEVSVQPAVIGSNVNLALKKFGRKMGPDPASITACMMGGILSNNSSGMCCGVHQNSYHTMKSIKFILPNGRTFNTAREDDYKRFEIEENQLFIGINKLKELISTNAELEDLIRKKYKQKNTTGYGLNSLIDFDHPLDCFAHLLIGAEGTLAFISEAVMYTVPDLPYKITGMLYFNTPEAAGSAILTLKSTDAEALEFMDGPSLRSVKDIKGVPEVLGTLPDQASGILVEFQAETKEKVDALYERAQSVFNNLPLIVPPQFSSAADEQAVLWKIRKGLYPSAASVRAKKTSTLLEDLTFPVERLGEAIKDVQLLFSQHGYHDGIIFGHAKDGNLHFCIAQNLSQENEVKRFEKFNDDLFDLVLKKYKGALKAEHGTGRAVAPFVQAEWGPEAYSIMKELKALVDPERLLNPNVILSEDPNIHLKDLKKMPVVEEEVDKCVECGYCERRCPSRDITMTPRQRISIRRSLKRLEEDGQKSKYQAILADYQHDGMDTCAVDGMCATDCPVSINTGELIKRLRKESHSSIANRIALMVAKNFRLTESIVKIAITSGKTVNKVLGPSTMRYLTKGIKKLIPSFPLWSNFIDHPAKINPYIGINSSKKVVYFSSCITRMMGDEVANSIQNVCKKAQIEMVFTKTVTGSCCGQIYSSKGFSDAYSYTVNKTIESLWETTQNGKIPVLLDISSCTQSIKSCRSYLSQDNQIKFDKIKIYDTIDFSVDHILPNLSITQKKKSIVLHPVCSVTKLGLQSKLELISKACAEQYHIPHMTACCGMAGDRGFYFPDLTRAATMLEAAEVNENTYDGYYSSGKTCEMALSEAVGKQYESLFKLMDEVSS